MRKNNFLKIFVSLVMCLMLVLSLVACGGSGEKGEKGDKGDKGDAGVDGVGIAAVTYEDGKLVINYTNNATDSFELVAEAATCEHNYSEPVEVVKHAIDADGTYLTVCGKCGVAAVDVKTIHVYDDKIVEATCIDYGYTAKVCECGHETGKVVGTEYADHEWSTQGWVASDVSKVCTDKGQMLIQSCSVCAATQTAYTEEGGLGHDVKTWAKGTLPTLTNPGTLTSVCERCAATVTEDLPILNAEDYDFSVSKKATSCNQPGEAKYVYTADNGQTFDYTAAIAPTNHVLNGVAASSISLDVNGTLFAYGTAGVTYVGENDDVTCGSTGTGFYKCEECDKHIGVTIVRSHKGEPVEGAEAVYVDGPGEDRTKWNACNAKSVVEIVKCELCKSEAADLVMVTYPVGHNYEVSYEVIEAAAGNTVEFDATCKNEGCTHFNLSDVVVDEEDFDIIAASTCATFGSVKIALEDNATLEAKLAKVSHTLNGKAIEENADFIYNGAPVYKTTLTGITVFDKELVCGKYDGDYATAMYTCEVCGKLDKIDTVYLSHTGTWTADIDPEDGKFECGDENGEVTYAISCDNKDCSKQYKSRVDSAVAHKYEFKFTTKLTSVETNNDANLNKCGLYSACAYCEIVDRSAAIAFEEGEYNVITEYAEATCTSPRIDRYEFKIDDKDAYLDVEVGTRLKHTIGGKTLDKYFFNADKNAYDFAQLTGVTPFDSMVCGGAAGQGMYKCEVCGKSDLINIYRNHSSADAYYASDDAKPTCTATGTLTMLSCDYCHAEGTKNAPLTATVPANGHTYDDVLDARFDGAKYVVDLKCTVEGCVYTETKNLPMGEDDYTSKTVAKATCAVNGLTVLTWELEDLGVTVKFNKVTLKSSVECKLEKVSKDEDAKLKLYIVADTSSVRTKYYVFAKCTVCGNFEESFDGAPTSYFFDEAEAKEFVADYYAEDAE